MNKITPELAQKFEFYAIFLNNIFLLLGVLIFGWTLFETLFLFWLELIAALVVLNYVVLVVPIKYGRPNLYRLPEYQGPALKTILISCYTLILHYFALVFIIDLGQVGSWDTSQGVWHTLAQLPWQLWQGSLLLLTILFLVAYLLPPLLLERQGFRPSLDRLPMQTKVMIHPSQFITHYLWFLCLWGAHQYFSIESPALLMTILMVLKSAHEAYIFHKIKQVWLL